MEKKLIGDSLPSWQLRSLSTSLGSAWANIISSSSVLFLQIVHLQWDIMNTLFCLERLDIVPYYSNNNSVILMNSEGSYCTCNSEVIPLVSRERVSGVPEVSICLPVTNSGRCPSDKYMLFHSIINWLLQEHYPFITSTLAVLCVKRLMPVSLYTLCSFHHTNHMYFILLLTISKSNGRKSIWVWN